MANPRLIVNFQGLHHFAATFTTDATITFDRSAPYGTTNHRAPVKIVGDGQVALCDAEDTFDGVLARVEPDGSAVVDMHGSVEIAGVVGNGRTEVVADGAGGIKAPTTAGTGQFVKVLDTTDTTSFIWFS